MIIDGIEVEITHPDRVLFPKDGITKAELVEYYVAAADAILPHLRERPLNMQRFPRGIHAPGFVQQEAPEKLPEWVGRVKVEKEGGETTHIICENRATLAWLANLSCVTLHVWLSRIAHLDFPDRLIFDLDPDEDDFETVRYAAKLLRDLLKARALPAYLMTTGSRGLHVTVPLTVPLAGEDDFDSVRDYSQEIAAELAAQDPQRMTTDIRKDERKGRLFIDTLRNAYGHTAVAPFAVRARDGAPCAAPVRWEALDDPTFSARRYRLRERAGWLEEAGAAWNGFWESSARPEGLSQRTSQS